MKKIVSLSILIAFLMVNNLAPAEENETIQIKIGTPYKKVASMLGAPKEEVVFSSFWGNKRALYKLGRRSYCIIDYTFGRARNILFLEQMSEKEALQKFHEK